MDSLSVSADSPPRVNRYRARFFFFTFTVTGSSVSLLETRCRVPRSFV